MCLYGAVNECAVLNEYNVAGGVWVSHKGVAGV